MARRSFRTRQATMGGDATHQYDSDDEPATTEVVSEEATHAKAVQANDCKCGEASQAEHSSDKENSTLIGLIYRT